ncbi:MAG TPA: response regulator [Thermoanaerobaculia bacterium]|nr:response regulator [Thermoanaerobaculia bacterium]
MRRRLLLVEDNVVAAAAIQLALVDQGFDTEVVNLGRQAIGRLIQSRFDAVVIDLTLPDLDGGALAEMIRYDWPDLPMILMSGYDRPARLAPFLENRLTAFLQKPFEITALVSEIELRLSRSRESSGRASTSPRHEVKDTRHV